MPIKLTNQSQILFKPKTSAEKVLIDTSGLTNISGSDLKGALSSVDSGLNGLTVPVDGTAYGVSWNGNTDAATKNAIYNKIETIGTGGGVAPAIEDNAGTPALATGITKAEVLTLLNVADGAGVNVQSDWNAGFGDAHILNKPTIPSAYTHPNHTGDVTSVGDGVQTIAADAVTYAKMQNVVANNVILGNNVGAGGAVNELTAAEVRTLINVSDGANNYVHPNHTGDVASAGDGDTSIVPTTISGKPAATATGTDHILIFDSTDSSLKKALASDFINTGGQILYDAIVSAGGDDYTTLVTGCISPSINDNTTLTDGNVAHGNILA